MGMVLRVIIFASSGLLIADGLDVARNSVASLKAQAVGQLGQVVTLLSGLSRDVGALKGQMAAEEKGATEMRERIAAARRELSGAEASVLAIKALPEMIELPLKKSFASSYQLFDRLDAVAKIRSDLARGVTTDSAALVSEAQTAAQQVGRLQNFITALIEHAERLLTGLAQIRDAFVPKR
jgi:hypothetical protein